MRGALLIATLCVCLVAGVVRLPMTRLTRETSGLAGDATYSVSKGITGDIYPLGVFYTTIYVGCPSNPYNVIVDTGSSDLLIPSVDCAECHATPSKYDADASETSTPIMCGDKQCEYYESYITCNITAPNAVCSLGGVVYTDMFNVGGEVQTIVKFGATTNQTQDATALPRVDGIWGLAYSGLSAIKATPPFQLLVEAGVLENVFGICFNNNTGVLTLGGIQDDLYIDEISYLPQIGGNETAYQVQINHMKIAGQKVHDFTNGTGVTIIDSGTNNVLLESRAYNILKETLRASCDTDSPLTGVCGDESDTFFGGKCFDMTTDEIEAFPNLAFTTGTDLEVGMDPYDYIMVVEEMDSMWCFVITDGGKGPGVQLFGDILMQNYYTVFDRAHNQIGFAPVDITNCVGQ